MVKLPASMLEPITRLDWALYWAERGFPVIPGHHPLKNGACSCNKGAQCPDAGKHPRWHERDLPKGINDATVDPDKIRAWWTRWPEASIIGAMTGRLALDVDPKSGASWDSVADLPVTRKHLSGRGDGGGHLIFTLTPAQRAAGIKSNNKGKFAPGVDVKTGSGNYLMLPPTLHAATGQPYTIESSVETALPEWVVNRLMSDGEQAVKAGTAKVGQDGQVRSMLANLLSTVPKRGEGKANDWLTAVCGHLAKTYSKQRDLYDVFTAEAAAKLKPPLEDAQKVIESIWLRERENHPERSMAGLDSADHGYLAAGQGVILCAVKIGDKDSQEIDIAEWGNFNLQVKGIMRDPASGRVAYDLLLIRKKDSAEIECSIPGAALGDAKSVAKWLSGYGVTISQPERVVARGMPPHVKLQRYLEAQPAPETITSPALGWDRRANGFLTHEGVITTEGLQPFGSVRPDPVLRQSGSANYRYGFEQDRTEAQAVLAEVLTYQDEAICSVFGAWWAANLLKPQIMTRSSLFPALAIEAGSGSGKTNGFFSLMMQLGGNIGGESQYTLASLRNALAGNRSGLVWCDDLDDPARVHELVRSSTSNGTKHKMAEDNLTALNIRLVASMALTGEALAIAGQKAMIERFLILRPPVPTGRMSQHPGADKDRTQWQDILELTDEYPEDEGGLAVLAGHYVAMALGHADHVLKVLREVARGGGRVGEKEAVLRAGARLLDALTGHEDWSGGGTHATTVDAWLAEEGNSGRTFEGDNKLTMTVIPWALQSREWPRSPIAFGGGQPAFLEGDEDDLEGVTIWFSPRRLAQCWEEQQRGRVDVRTETYDALLAQARQICPDRTRDRTDHETGPQRKQWRTSKQGSGGKQYYWPLTGEAAHAVLERSRGHHSEGV